MINIPKIQTPWVCTVTARGTQHTPWVCTVTARGTHHTPWVCTVTARGTQHTHTACTVTTRLYRVTLLTAPVRRHGQRNTTLATWPLKDVLPDTFVSDRVTGLYCLALTDRQIDTHTHTHTHTHIHKQLHLQIRSPWADMEGSDM